MKKIIRVLVTRVNKGKCEYLLMKKRYSIDGDLWEFPSSEMEFKSDTQNYAYKTLLEQCCIYPRECKGMDLLVSIKTNIKDIKKTIFFYNTRLNERDITLKHNISTEYLDHVWVYYNEALMIIKDITSINIINKFHIEIENYD